MKHFGKKILALGLSLVIGLSLGVSASAATVPYGLTIKDKSLLFTQNGKTVGTFAARDNKVFLTTDKDGDFTANYYDKENKYRAVNLGSQTALTVSGKMDSLTLLSSLNSKITVTTASSSDIGTLKVSAPNAVRVQGKVDTLSVTSSKAKIALASSAKVTTKSITKGATLTTEKGATVGKKPATSTSKPSTSTSGTLKLKVSSGGLDADDGDRLRDILDDLNDAVYAYDSKTKEDVEGYCEWSSANNRELTKDGSYSFTFYPDDTSYSSVKGSIKVYVDGASGDVELVMEKSKISVTEGTKMKEVLEWVKDNTYAEDDDGDDVDGKFKWSYGSNDEARSRTYKFTFYPNSSRYDNESGEITVDVVSSGADI